MRTTTLTAAAQHARSCRRCHTKSGAKKYDGLCYECFYADIMEVGETSCRKCEKRILIAYRGLCRPCIEQDDAVHVEVVCSVCEKVFYCRHEKEFKKCMDCRKRFGKGQYGKMAIAESGAIAIFRSPGPPDTTCGRWDNLVRALDSISED